MAKRLEVRGRTVRPISPTRTGLMHLSSDNVTYGQVVHTVCGRSIPLRIGGRVESQAAWDNAHESLKCQPCNRALEQHGRVTS
jgi:hypothetical protein